jgi:hypothetical protein
LYRILDPQQALLECRSLVAKDDAGQVQEPFVVANEPGDEATTTSSAATTRAPRCQA